MRFLTHLPIRRKATLVILISCCLVLLAATAILFTIQRASASEEMAGQVHAFHRLVAERVEMVEGKQGENYQRNDFCSAIKVSPSQSVTRQAIRLPSFRKSSPATRREVHRLPQERGLT